MVNHGFATLGLHRIHASHLAPNTASGRVMRKLGMTQEGILREHVQKWQIRYDLVLYGLLRSECEAAQIEIVENDRTNTPRKG